MKDEHVDELIDLYALGALEPDEQNAVDAHLDECARCRAWMADARRVVALLPWTAEQQMPPSDLQGKVRRRIEGLQRQQRAPEQAHERVRTRRWLPPWLLGGSLAAACLALLIFLGIWNFQLQRQLASVSAELERSRQIERVLIRSGVRAVVLEPQPAAPKAWGTMMLNPTGNDAYLITYDLPVLPKNKTYQLWLQRGDARVNGGTFRVDEHGVATVQVRASEPMSTFTGCGVTIEPTGGSPGPTGDRVLRNRAWEGGTW
jgi:anti-sigma-K factor RskA